MPCMISRKKNSFFSRTRKKKVKMLKNLFSCSSTTLNNQVKSLKGKSDRGSKTNFLNKKDVFESRLPDTKLFLKGKIKKEVQLTTPFIIASSREKKLMSLQFYLNFFFFNFSTIFAKLGS